MGVPHSVMGAPHSVIQLAQEMVQVQAEPNQRWLVILLFMVAGLFAGGAWSGYKNRNWLILGITAAMTVVTLTAAGFWLVSEL